MSSETFWKAAEEDMRTILTATDLTFEDCKTADRIRAKIREVKTQDNNVKNAVVRICTLTDNNLIFLVANFAN